MRTNWLAKDTSWSGGGHSGMPRYFFHVRRGQVTVLDQEGVELTDIEAAAKEAARRGQDISAQDAAQGIASSGGAIVVANQHWSPIFEVPLEGDDA